MLAACEDMLSKETCPFRIIILEQWIHNHKVWLADNEAKVGAIHDLRRIVEGGG